MGGAVDIEEIEKYNQKQENSGVPTTPWRPRSSLNSNFNKQLREMQLVVNQQITICISAYLSATYISRP